MDIKKITTETMHYLMKNSTPHGIALGVSIGVFIVMTPTYGFHTLMVVALACVIPQANKMAMLLGTMISFPLTLPFITWASYDVGRLFLQGYPELNGEYFRHLSRLSVWGILKEVKDVYALLFVGGLALGLVLGIFVYVSVYFLVRFLKSRKAK